MKDDAFIDDKIMALIATGVPGKFKKVAIARETHLQKELGLDSIGILSMVFRFEEAFELDITQLGVQINIAKLKTVADLIAAAQDILSKAAETAETKQA